MLPTAGSNCLQLCAHNFGDADDAGCADACSEAVTEQLRAWAKQDPFEVLSEPRFYQDFLLRAPSLEATALVVVARDLPLQDVQECALLGWFR